MKNIKLMVKLLGGFGLVAFMVLCAGFFGLMGARTLTSHLHDFNKRVLPGAQALLSISEAMEAIDNNENTLLARNINAKGREEQYTLTAKHKKRLDESWKLYENLSKSKEETEIWNRFIAAWQKWWQNHEQFLSLAKDFEDIPTEDAYNKMSQQTLVTNTISFYAAKDILNRIVLLNNKEAKTAEEMVLATSARVEIVIIIGMILGVIIALFFGLVLTLGVTKPIAKAVAYVEQMAAGDMTQKLDVDQKDEIGMLAKALQAMVERLKQVVLDVQNAADNVAAESRQMSSGSEEMSQGATEQAAAAEEASSSMEEMGANIKQNADNALQT
ncbi:MAG: HAMP domain-containing protein, partial [Desulfobacteraceae bacterium]